MATRLLRLRRYIFENLEPSAWPHPGLSPANMVIVSLIVAAVALAIVESEVELVSNEYLQTFSMLEFAFTIAFATEYGLRLWSNVENPRYGHGLTGRLRYLRTPAAIIDFLALSPIFFASIGGEMFLLRLFRLLRILRLGRLGRFSSATGAIMAAVHSRRYELAMTAVIGFFLLLFSSTLLYMVEAEAQPIVFGSIPRAMWWSIATLTTVGYGDVVPITVAGRILAGVTALTGIGLIAMPTGILAAAFSDALQAQRRYRQAPNENTKDARD